jgi:inositol polyphosphate-4-phosphatase
MVESIPSLETSETTCQSNPNKTKPNEKVRNKFTEGLDFDSLNDWTTELKPSMQKLRQAMDGLLKTARLTHSVFRIQEDRRIAQTSCNIRYRRHVCFSQAVSHSNHETKKHSVNT